MITKHLRILIVATTLPFIQPLSAELPMLEPPWLGDFAVANESSFRFILTKNGDFKILVLNKNRDPIESYPIALQFLATEVLPDGSKRDLTMNWNTVESSDPANAKMKKTVLRSKLTEQATGQPTLEITIEVSGGTLLANARITDKGSLAKNLARPVIRMGFKDFYGEENAQKATWDKKQIRDFDKLISKDFVRLKHLDGKTIKLACVEKTNLKPNEINGGGSSLAEVEISAYQNKTIEFLADPDSSLTLDNAGAAPLHNGFRFEWSSDTAKDLDGKAKLAIRIK